MANGQTRRQIAPNPFGVISSNTSFLSDPSAGGGFGGGFAGGEPEFGSSFGSSRPIQIGGTDFNATPFGRDTPLTFTSSPFLRPEGANVVDPLQLGLAGIGQPSRTGLDALRGEALRTGPSNFARLQAQQAQENIAQQAAGGAATARGNLAARGGLSSGARERLEQNTILQSLFTGQQARQGISQADELNRQGLLRALPGAELAQFGAESGALFQEQGLLSGARQFQSAQEAQANQFENQFRLAQDELRNRLIAGQIEADAILNA